MGHQYVVTNHHALAQQVALLARTGFYFWTSGVIPEDKDPLLTDRRLEEKYGLGVSKYVDYRRKKKGGGKVKYLRFGQHWWLLATQGDHPIFQEEKLRDLRESPVLAFGYAIALYDGRISVRIERDAFKRLKEKFEQVAVGASATWLERRLWNLPFEPWHGVRQQAFQLLAMINAKRKKAGLILLDHKAALRDKRRTFKVFGKDSFTGG